MSTVEYTVWKFKNFPSSQILREINFDNISDSKSNENGTFRWPNLTSRKICVAENF